MPRIPPQFLTKRADELRFIAFALLLATALSFLNGTAVFRVADGLLFDAVSTRAAPQDPKVLIIEQDAAFENMGDTRFDRLIESAARVGIKRIGFAQAPGEWQKRDEKFAIPVIVGLEATRTLTGGTWLLDPTMRGRLPDGASPAASMIATPEYGIYRRQLTGLLTKDGIAPTFEAALSGRKPDTGHIYIQLPRDQSIPRARASQLIDHAFGQNNFSGMVAIVEPAGAWREKRFTTPLTPQSQMTTASMLRANVVQNMMDGKTTQRLSVWSAFLLIFIATLIAALILRSVDAKRVMILAIAFCTSVTLIAGWLSLSLAGAILPISAMLAALVIASVAVVIFRENSQDKRLQSVLERAIGFSYSRSILNEQANLSHFVTDAARNLAITSSAIFHFGDDGAPIFKENFGLELRDMPDVATLQNIASQIERTGLVLKVNDDNLLNRGEQHFVARLDEASHSTFWLFSIDKDDAQTVRQIVRAAQNIATTYAGFYRWRADLSASDNDFRKFQPIDRQIASAASLVSTQSEQMREGLEKLDTGIAIYHMGGFPVHANAAMQRLYGDADLNLSRASLSEALSALTMLEEAAIQDLVQKLLATGQEIRVPGREFTAKQRVLRIAMHREEDADRGWLNLVVIEAIDISELAKLANLRHAVSNFVDKQLRTDLEALDLGLDSALARAGEMPGLTKVLNRMRDVSRRATGRLDEVAKLMDDADITNLAMCHPVDARKIVKNAYQRVRARADDYEVDIALNLPEISGFTMAEPSALLDTVEAMLDVVIADTPHGGSASVVLQEGRGTTMVEVTGGIGIPFERLIAAFDAGTGGVPREFKAISNGIADAIRWGGQVSYWSSVGKGYRFMIKLRRVG